MRSIIFALGTLTLLAVSPASAASHIIGNDDEPVSRATDGFVRGRTEGSQVLTLSYAPRGSRAVADQARAWVPGGTIGDDDRPVSSR